MESTITFLAALFASDVSTVGGRVRLDPRAGGHEVRDSSAWPDEPASPIAVDAESFAAALTTLCGKRMPSERAAAIAAAVLDVAAAGAVDPFLLAALAQQQSGCRPRLHTRLGIGLTQIRPATHARRKVLSQAIDGRRLVEGRYNLEVAAALLRAWQTRHDATFIHRGKRHRSGVAHFVWGDVVASATREDHVFTARRRLLELYERRPAEPFVSVVGAKVVSPLGGAPRLATSGMGVDRDGGARSHGGIDIDADVGEPVRSVADGIVYFAGADRPAGTAATPLSPRMSRRFSRKLFGPGGLFVCVSHTQDLMTCYFHLASFAVVRGQRVAAGDTIGAVGRTGVRHGESHLHFEVRVRNARVNPVPVLAHLLVPPEETVGHRVAVKKKRDRLRAARRLARMR